MSEALVELKSIRKYFRLDSGHLDRARARYLHAVDDVSFTIQRGEIFGVIGESGSGKSTIGRCILRLLDIDAGEIWYDGVQISRFTSKEMKDYRRRMQMIFQNPIASFNPKKTIGASFREIGKVYKIPSDEMEKRIQDMVRYINLTGDVLSRLPRELSGGQLQRLAIARALLLEPEFLLADEPVSALDVSVQAQVLNLLLDLKRNQGLTILFISHDLTVVRQVCDTVAVVYLGVIVEMGPADAVYTQVLHPYTQALIAAKPKEHPAEEKEHILLEGEIPTAINVKEGCRFSGRCPRFREGLCSERTPKLRNMGAGHYVACHYPLQRTDVHNT